MEPLSLRAWMAAVLLLGGCAATGAPTPAEVVTVAPVPAQSAEPAQTAAPKPVPERFAEPPLRFDPEQPADRPPGMPGPGYHCHFISPGKRYCHSGLD